MTSSDGGKRHMLWMLIVFATVWVCSCTHASASTLGPVFMWTRSEGVGEHFEELSYDPATHGGSSVWDIVERSGASKIMVIACDGVSGKDYFGKGAVASALRSTISGARASLVLPYGM